MTPDFPQSEEEAVSRSARWKERDPYPEIAPALLNSAEIIDYVAATGMVYPFRTSKDDEQKLKPASYEIDLLGDYVFWDEDGKKVQGDIKRGDPFELRRNSIAFVSVEPRFRLPDYIAARFNLRIKHVYRGILLGTGPLVDPGFQGPLYIPLHNLTSENYLLVGGEALIWMEFTKLSWPRDWSNQAPEAPTRSGTFVQFERRKTFKDLDYYLEHANRGRPIRSSIPIEIKNASDAAQRAEQTVRRFTFTFSISAAVGLVITALAFVVAGYGLLFQAVQFASDAHKEVHELGGRIEEAHRKLDLLTRSIEMSARESEIIPPPQPQHTEAPVPTPHVASPVPPPQISK